ncbi:glycoside hydrolase family 3 N-terminal domain-containing protein [Cellulomonas timonensis]|uniref:glycoside hydrolase family 3 N-terminal domain-containing protein n=1 Tax=Cellulomonas timonensis TaxID=1689271 RepID=UPI00083439E1|nr:glycoside hydrolase family 3 N-terminal domain-containing protein [Cellulomonas timonensis]
MIDKLTLLERAALLTGKSVWETHDVPRLGLRSVWLADGPHGVRKQVGSADHLGLHGSEPATCFPTAATIANSWDPVLAEEVGQALGAEAAWQGVDVLLGPGLNIKRSPLGGRSFEYFSEDPLLAGKLAAAYVRGIQSQGVAACPKHYAANSQELRRMVSDSVVDERTLREITGTMPPAPRDPALPSHHTGDIRRVSDAEFAALLGRPVPASTWSGPLGANDALGRMATARSPLARLAYRVLAWRKDRSDAKGTPDLSILFLLNMPFRAIGKMTNGMVSAEMVDGIVRIVNGRHFPGARIVGGGFPRNRRANRRSARELSGRR